MKRVLVVVGAALVLAGCGTTRPGAAVVIGDTAISMSQADETAEVYCRLAVLSSPEGAPISNADVRRQAVTDLAFGVVARDLVEERNLRVRPTSYELTPDQRQEITDTFRGGDVEAVIEAIVDSQLTFAIAQRLGARVSAPEADPAQVQEAGFREIQAELVERKVRFDPRFGIGRDGQPKAPTGSLSVPAKETTPDEKGLPATQRCTG